MPAKSTLQSTVLKEGPLELWEPGSRSWVPRHAEICLRTPDEPDERDVCCLAYRIRPARRELGNAVLKSSLLGDAEQPDTGGTAAPSPPCPSARAARTRILCPAACVAPMADSPRAIAWAAFPKSLLLVA